LAIKPTLRLSQQDTARASDMLDHVDLSGFGDRLPSDISGGQQSRAALARVLLADRPVVLLDEPFAALGPGLKNDMLDLVHTLLARTDRTVIMVTHDPADAKRIAEETALVASGQVARPVATTALFADPPPSLAEYLGDT